MTSKKPAYQQVDMSDATDDETDTTTNSNKAKYTKISNRKKPKTFCQWIWHKPFSKLPLLYFLTGILASIANAVFYLMDNDTAFIICGILGSSICFYGIKHFYTLMGLKKQIDTFGNLNIKFGKERRLVSKQVDRINAANTELRETHNRLQQANERNRENLDHFREIEYNMEQFGKTSLAELQDLMKKSKAIEHRWHENLYAHQKQLLHTVFERVERQGSTMGMNAEEFKEFEMQLPEEYRERFDRMGTFHKLSKDDSIIDYDDFRASLDLFAEMVTDDVDIDFEIEKKRKQIKKRSKQIKFRTMDSVNENDDDGDNDEYKIKEKTSFSPKGDERFKDIFSGGNVDPEMKMPEIGAVLKETESIDLEDIEYDENEADEMVMYERKIVVTKRTMRGHKFTHTLNDNDHDSDESDENGPLSPSSGLVLKKHHFKVTDESGKDDTVKLKTLGVRQFGDILDDVDDHQ